MEIVNYKHKIIEVVRFHEVDMLGVCNNTIYFNYFEDARIKYTQDIKKTFSLSKLYEGNSFIIMAHNECDYLEPAYLDDELHIHSRISFIKTTSFGFRHLVEKVSSGKIIARGGGVVVHIDKFSKKPLQLPQEFYDAIQQYENKVEIIRSM